METNITLELNNPLTDEQWDAIADVDFDRTKQIWFTTKHGKRVEFMKVIHCKDCKHYKKEIKSVGGHYNGCGWWLDEGCASPVDEDGYCSYAERKDSAKTD